MEDPTELGKGFEQKKEIQKSKATEIRMKVWLKALLNAHFFFVNKIELKLPFAFIDQSNKDVFIQAIREVLTLGYIDIGNLHKDIVYPFIEDVLSDFSEEKVKEASEKITLLFSSGFGANYLSIQKLNTLIERLEGTNDDDFKSLLRDMGFTKKHQVFHRYKIALVDAYKLYINNVNQRLKTLQELMPGLTLDNLNSCFLDIERYTFEAPHLKQERFIIELMRMYSLYPQYQRNINRIILQEAKPQLIVRGEEKKTIYGREFIAPKYEGETAPINLLTAAQTLMKEGLFPAHIKLSDSLTREQAKSQPRVGGGSALDKEKYRLDIAVPQESSEFTEPTADQKISLENTVKLFSQYGSVLNEFEGFSESPQYKDNMDKFYAVAKVNNILNNAKTVQDYVIAYKLMEPYINRHKHIKWDSFFGNKITRTWNNVIKQIRERALEALTKEVNALDKDNLDTKIKRLTEACKMPLFNEHRNNHWYTGKFGDTHAVSVIKKEISILEDQRNRSVLAPA